MFLGQAFLKMAPRFSGAGASGSSLRLRRFFAAGWSLLVVALGGPTFRLGIYEGAGKEKGWESRGANEVDTISTSSSLLLVCFRLGIAALRS